MLDDDGIVGSMWRYELRDGGEPATTAIDRRLAELCRNMTTTITAMVATENAMGATR